MTVRSPLYETFKATLAQVAGGAFAAAGYALEDAPMHHMRGLFRYRRQPAGQDEGWYIEFQVLNYGPTGGGPSRFRVGLLRGTADDPRAPGGMEVTLARLVWDRFGVRGMGLSGPEHWWAFGNDTQMAYAIAEAGKLLFAFGVPWLEGTLEAPG